MMVDRKLYSGLPHTVDFESGVEIKGESNEKVPRALTKEEEIIQVTIQEDVSLPVFSVSYGELEKPENFKAELEKINRNDLILISRIAERAAFLSRITEGFAHPAGIERGAKGIRFAKYAAVPQIVEHQGESASTVNEKRRFQEKVQLRNYYPADMYVKLPTQEEMTLPHIKTIEPKYKYENVGLSVEGVMIARSTIKQVLRIPKEIAADELLLVHPEVPIEALRTGVTPETVAKMVFPYRIKRGENGQQQTTFQALGFYSVKTLDQVTQEIGF